MYYSAQGAEHLHKIMKRVAKEGSSRQPATRVGEVGTALVRDDHMHEQYPSPTRPGRARAHDVEPGKRPQFLGVKRPAPDA